MYQLKFLGKAQKDLEKIDISARKFIKEKLLLLAHNPDIFKNNIKKLRGTDSDYYRLRIGDYRVIFQRLDMELIIIVIRIGHRKDIYQSFE